MPGVLLSDEGQTQAARLAEAMSGRRLAAVISSPLERAQQTAAALAARQGLMVQTDPALDEADFGAWSGRRFTDLAGPEWEAWNSARGLAPAPGGETMLAVQARAVAALHRWAALHRDGDVALVSHQDVLKSILAQVLGMPLDLLHRFDLTPASRSVVVWGEGWARVDSLNG